MLTQFKILLDEPNLADILKKDSVEKDAVQTLQQMLYELGFGRELGWTPTGADGRYGEGTSAAVRAFAEKRGLPADGDRVTPEVAAAIADAYEIAAPLRTLHDLVNNGEVENTLFRRSDAEGAVMALQILLHRQGFDEELNWARFGADGDYGGGTTKAVLAFAAKEGIDSDGARVSGELARRLLDKFASSLGDEWAKEENTAPPKTGLPPELKRHKSGRGAFTVGKHSAPNFIAQHPDALREIGLTDSLMRVMSAVSRNEGMLEAVNTWDNSFMTFGMFQWTIGAKPGKAELPSLLKKIKDRKPAAFHRYFGQYDLDVSDKYSDFTEGLLTLRGRLLRSLDRKERLRQDDWAVRFWQAGLDPDVQAIEIEHAAGRLKRFYWKGGIGKIKHPLSMLVTSEYGVAHLLDNHVNRPVFVRECIDLAMEEVKDNIPDDPAQWTTEEEHRLLAAYLKIRETYKRGKTGPMTHAALRAQKIDNLRKAQQLNGERNSFVFNPNGTHNLAFTGVLPPDGYRDEDYPEIEME